MKSSRKNETEAENEAEAHATLSLRTVIGVRTPRSSSSRFSCRRYWTMRRAPAASRIDRCSRRYSRRRRLVWPRRRLALPAARRRCYARLASVGCPRCSGPPSAARAGRACRCHQGRIARTSCRLWPYGRDSSGTSTQNRGAPRAARRRSTRRGGLGPRTGRATAWFRTSAGSSACSRRRCRRRKRCCGWHSRSRRSTSR